MKLYNRDYMNITDAETEEIEALKKQYTTKLGEFEVMDSTYYRKQPKAGRHYDSLFPNNYLDIVDLKNEELLSSINNEFADLIDNPTTIERTVLSYLNDKEKCKNHIIGSLFKYYSFGHHAAFMIPEFKLGTTYCADYLLIGKSSDGYQFIFVELESVYGRITRKGGQFGQVINKGIEQVEDWNRWLDRHYKNLHEVFSNITNEPNLPSEFHTFDSSRMHYVVVAGRRNDFNELTYELKRRLEKNNNIKLLHYDNLVDSAYRIINEASY